MLRHPNSGAFSAQIKLRKIFAAAVNTFLFNSRNIKLHSVVIPGDIKGKIKLVAVDYFNSAAALA